MSVECNKTHFRFFTPESINPHALQGTCMWALRDAPASHVSIFTGKYQAGGQRQTAGS